MPGEPSLRGKRCSWLTPLTFLCPRPPSANEELAPGPTNPPESRRVGFNPPFPVTNRGAIFAGHQNLRVRVSGPETV